MSADAIGARQHQCYGDAEGYDTYMGRWSAVLAPLFLDFAALGRPQSLLDVGAGTGNLLAAARTAFSSTRLVGIDPSPALLERARLRRDLEGAELINGAGSRLPFSDDTFDGCLSLLVLQEFSDLLETIVEMKRVTRSDGVVAACQWDFRRMPVIHSLVEAIKQTEPDVGAQLAARRVGVEGEADLLHYWQLAGLHEVVAARVKVVQRFGDFEELWRPLMAGSTPSTIILANLSVSQQERVRHSMEVTLQATPGGPLELHAEALAVRGRS